ncbi:hypothetical protein [Streptacidiphilus sp. MAP5-3]|uniref:hypothetical protein n=1 Tax=unclassified Streptacidiphilus TaxID=2643834 RepID=UPI003516811C
MSGLAPPVPQREHLDSDQLRGLSGILADTYCGWSSSNPSRYTAQTPGWHRVSGTVRFPNNATGNRGLRIAKNGNAVQGTGTLVDGHFANVPELRAKYLHAVVVEIAVFASTNGALKLDQFVGDREHVSQASERTSRG